MSGIRDDSAPLRNPPSNFRQKPSIPISPEFPFGTRRKHGRDVSISQQSCVEIPSFPPPIIRVVERSVRRVPCCVSKRIGADCEQSAAGQTISLRHGTPIQRQDHRRGQTKISARTAAAIRTAISANTISSGSGIGVAPNVRAQHCFVDTYDLGDLLRTVGRDSDFPDAPIAYSLAGHA
jgi:hypothetical protein